MDAVTTKESPNRKALGRGLAALIPNSPAASPTSSLPTAAASGLRLLPIERIKPNKRQPRKVFEEGALEELTSSIKTQGILQPIVVRRDGDSYEIVAGERRWRAATRAGLHEMPAIIKDYDDNQALQVGLIENLQRQDLDPLEEAEGYHRLIKDYNLTHDEVAVAVGKSRSAISNSMRMLKLPTSVLDKLADGRLSAGHARALMTLTSNESVEKLASDIVERRLSVRDAEHHARQLQKSNKKKPAAQKRTVEESSVEERLQRALGTKVRLHHRKGRGRVEIYFHSFEELDSILDRVSA